MDESLKTRILAALRTLERTARGPEDADEARALIALLDPPPAEEAVPEVNQLALDVQAEAATASADALAKAHGEPTWAEIGGAATPQDIPLDAHDAPKPGDLP